MGLEENPRGPTWQEPLWPSPASLVLIGAPGQGPPTEGGGQGGPGQ